MENWGLIVYRESCLLVDEEETSATSRQWIALVVGHEVRITFILFRIFLINQTTLLLGCSSMVRELCHDGVVDPSLVCTLVLFCSYNRWKCIIMNNDVLQVE
jgi:hypothetical protein